jgi:signal transduction histidine kinase
VEGVRRGDEVVIRVTNHGPAITDEALQTLFEPFKRGSLDNPTNPRGLGLGLYIAYQIALAHGGSIHATTRDGKTCMRTTLPV